MKPSRQAEARRSEGALYIDPRELRELYDELKAMDRRMALELRRAIAEAGQHVRGKVVANATETSTETGRIPAAVRVSTSFRGKKAGASIVVGSRRAPEARPLESLGLTRMFRHPVYGNRQVWVSQRSKPFFFRSVDAQAVQVSQARVLAALDRAARAAGLS